MLSVDICSWWRRGWLSVEARDHLGRGNNANGLHAKVADHLQSEVGLRVAVSRCVSED